jgi:hypothetical protein
MRGNANNNYKKKYRMKKVLMKQEKNLSHRIPTIKLISPIQNKKTLRID